MSAQVGVSFDRSWIEEQTHWSDYYLRHLQEQVAWATIYARQPDKLSAHCGSLLALLAHARAWPRLHAQAAELVAALGAWPARWGYWDTWEDMLRFGVKATDLKESPARYFALLAELAILLLDTGRLDSALDMGLQVVTHSAAVYAPVPLARAADLAIQTLMRQGKMGDAGHLLEQVEQQLRQFDDAGGAWAYVSLTRSGFLRRQGDLDGALLWADRAVAVAEAPSRGDLHLSGEAYDSRGIVHWVRGEYDLAAADLNQAAALYAGSGDRYAEACVRGNLGLVYWSLGELDRAESLFRHMIALGEQQGTHWQMAVNVGNMGLVYLSRGKLEQALSYSERHFQMATQNRDIHEIMRARGIRGVTLLHRGDFVAALADLDVNRAFHEERGSPEGLVCNYVSYARCLAAQGREEEARDLTQQALDIAREKSLPSLQVLALRSLAEQSPMAQREPLLREALALAQRMGRQLDQAACLLSLAALKEGEEQTRLWTQGERLLKGVGAAAWLRGCLPQRPPQIVLAG